MAPDAGACASGDVECQACESDTDDDGVCDAQHRVHGRQGLYVMDGSAVPSSLGANPQVTIMALAGRAAARLADHLQEHQA